MHDLFKQPNKPKLWHICKKVHTTRQYKARKDMIVDLKLGCTLQCTHKKVHTIKQCPIGKNMLVQRCYTMYWQWWTWFSIDGEVQQWVKQILTPRVHAHGFVKCSFGDIWEIVGELVLSNRTKLSLTIIHLFVMTLAWVYGPLLGGVKKIVIFEMKGN
jgi:hypothetical protein